MGLRQGHVCRLAVGDRILIKDQASGPENGIYTVNASGAPTRARDFDRDWKVETGVVVEVEEGTVNGWSSFVLATTGAITVDTSSLTFRQVNSLRATRSWTPTLTAVTTNPTLGTGSSSGGNYHRIGRRVWFDISLQFGSSGESAGSGVYLLSLPVVPVARTMIIGSGMIADASASTLLRTVQVGILASISSTNAVLIVDNAAMGSGDTPVANDQPWVWGASDSILIAGSYEASAD